MNVPLAPVKITDRPNPACYILTIAPFGNHYRSPNCLEAALISKVRAPVAVSVPLSPLGSYAGVNATAWTLLSIIKVPA